MKLVTVKGTEPLVAAAAAVDVFTAERDVGPWVRLLKAFARDAARTGGQKPISRDKIAKNIAIEGWMGESR